MTPYTEIFDLFLQQVEDYRLDSLFNTSESNFNIYLTGFLVLAIPDFSSCNQDLSDRNDTLMEFNFTMSDINKKILSKLMVKEWLGKEVKDIMQMRWNITDADFKHYAESQNLREKQGSYDKLSEECSQALVSYGYSNMNIHAWMLGNFLE